MLKYDKLFALLDAKGYKISRIKEEKIMGQATYYGLKDGTKGMDTKTIDTLCRLLDCQPGDILEYVPDEVE